MTSTIINGVLRLVAIVAMVWIVADILTPWVARHEVTVVIRPQPHPIVRGSLEWRT
jgi:hypothetical protein